MSHRLTSKRIGLYGGSFDPPHLGHIALVEQALAVLPLDELRIVPVGIPVHRELSGRGSTAQRLHWIETLFAGMPRVSVWDWEARRGVPTPTIDTLRQLKAELTGFDVRILLMLGGDAFAGMESWREYPQHRELCDVAVFTRQGVPRPKLAGWRETSVDEWGEMPGHGQVMYVDSDLPDVSATGLRAVLEAGESIPAGLPSAIADEVLAAYRQ